jgi:hypothetical protein
MRIDRVLVGFLIAAAGSPACREAAAPAQGPASIAIVSGDGQEAVTRNGSQTFSGSGALPDSLRVRVANRAGAPVPGALVRWMTMAGSVSPTATTTDSEGMAATRWSWFAPQTDYVTPGVYTATAVLPGVGSSVTFTGFARVGAVLRDLRMTPDTVSVASGPAEVTVTLRATDDRAGFGLVYTSVQFYSPTGTPPQGWLLPLTMVSGTPADGVWEGRITIPQGAHPGDWEIGHVTLSWGCGVTNRVELFGPKLTSLGLPLRLHVKAAADHAYSAPRIGQRTSAALVSDSVQATAHGGAAGC